MNDLFQWAVRWGVPRQAIDDLVARTTAAREDGENHEGDVQARIRLDAPKWGGALWRNNNGSAYNKQGRPVRFGVGNDSVKINRVWKSSDLVGIAPGGTFLAVECKREGWRWTGTDRERAQWNFLTNVQALGGRAGFATCVEDARRIAGL